MILLITIIIAVIIIAVFINKQDEREAQEEAEHKKAAELAEKRRLEKERIEKAKEEARLKYEAELERRRSTKCIICKECSMGNTLCSNCKSRLNMLQDEIPKAALISYEALSKHLKYTKKHVITTKSNEDRIYYSMYLLAIANKLKEKYYIDNAEKATYNFLKEYADLDFIENQEFLEKYEIDPETNKEEFELFEVNRPQINYEEAVKLKKEKKEEKIPQQNGKTFRCNDGDYVRSKAEREIDNFFFNNRIWHIYEQPYKSPVEDITTHPDFYLSDHNLYIEYFGLNTPEYIEIREKKIKMYKADSSIKFEYLTFKDDEDINTKLIEICKKHNIPMK